MFFVEISYIYFALMLKLMSSPYGEQQVIGSIYFCVKSLKDEIKPFGKSWKYFFLKSKQQLVEALAIGKVYYSKILGGCIIYHSCHMSYYNDIIQHNIHN